MKDMLGNFLRVTPHFMGKWRFRRLWQQTLSQGDHRIARLPDGSVLKVNLDVPYEQMVWLQDEEWGDLRYLRRKLRAGEVFIDVGANIGLWTLVAASSVGPGGHVFSFEPNPSTFKRLVENIALNEKTSYVETIPKATLSEKGMVCFKCEAHHNLSAISSDCSAPGTTTVPSVELDCLLANDLAALRLAGIKLDTEGCEFETLQGATGLIDRRQPWLIVEFNTTLLASNILGDWPVYQFLTTRGYRPFVYDRWGNEVEINAAYSLRGYRNILFVRRVENANRS